MSPRPPFPPPELARSGKQRWIIGLLLGIVLAGGGISFVTSGAKAPKRDSRRPDLIQITLPPPPAPVLPPPPKVEPPPPKEEPPEEEMIAQEPVAEDEPPPDDSPPEAPPSEDPGGGVPGGNGPDMGLGSGNGTGGGRIGGTGRKGGSKYGRYFAQVQTSLIEALRKNPSLKNAKMNVEVRIWPDSGGRITRVQLVGTAGSPDKDQVLKNEVLSGYQLPQGTPADLPLPIVLRIAAK